jgi:phosphopantothenoylcysteine decarboxylase/phosphopantothenate--cysteine ligase
MFDTPSGEPFPHIRWAERADAMVVMPATANIIGKIANGIADDCLTTLLLAVKTPVLVCPSMNVRMYENPLVQNNLEVLRAAGLHVVDASTGELACGEEGVGRLADLGQIVEQLERSLSVPDLEGTHVLVTAGPTREFLDPVRFLSNPSSGKMGYALARAAWRRGAEVALVSGPTCLSAPASVSLFSVTTGQEMHDVVMDQVRESSIVIKTAAVCDWRPKERFGHKVKKDSDTQAVSFEQTTDILKALGDKKGRQLLVGFAAETEKVIQNGAAKLAAKNLDMIVANRVGSHDSGFGADTNRATLLFGDGGIQELPLCTKESLADIILDQVVEMRAKA